ncbi:LamG domain-containing protein [Halomonas sp.]|uniref:LamG domain-containing protein n=1 Tax=Halomonas sp. TaxID=1486246 RepID=UPI00298D86F4|nr:LamG domain-containing protein [Halomonas sp.]MDW7746596.1 LamG domain-containing protein [Halomonas sp.]
MQITVRWVDMNYGEVEQRVYRSTSPLDPQNLPAALGVVGPGVEKYMDDTAVEGETYYYRVESVAPDNTTYLSDEFQITADLAYPVDVVCYFTGDAVSGSTVTEETGTYNGEIIGTVDQVVGSDGFALSFPGSTSSYVRFGQSLFTTVDEFTLSLWIKTTDRGAWLTKVASTFSNNGFIFFRNVTAQTHFRVASGGTLSTGIDFVTTIWDGEWHHIAATYSADGMKLYVDGVLDNSSSEYIGTLNISTSAYWNIGRDSRGQDPINADIDNLRIYEYELSAAGVAGLFNANK